MTRRRVLTYRYGARPPLEGMALLELQRRLRQRYARQLLAGPWLTPEALEARRAEQIAQGLSRSGCYLAERQALYCRKQKRRLPRLNPRFAKVSLIFPGGQPLSQLWGTGGLEWQPTGTDRKGRQYGVLVFPLNEGSAVRIPLKLHRPLPAEGRCLEVRFGWRERGGRWRYSVDFVVELPAPAAALPPGGEARLRVALRPGPAALEVACWWGDDGAEGRVRLPLALLRQQEQILSLLQRQRLQEKACREALLRWAGSAAQPPDWLAAHLQRLAQKERKSHAPLLVRLWQDWTARGVLQETPAFAALADWQARYQESQAAREKLQEKLNLHRRELYRVVAARLARRYARVRITVEDQPVALQYTRLATYPQLIALVRHACRREGRACWVEEAEVPAHPARAGLAV